MNTKNAFRPFQKLYKVFNSSLRYKFIAYFLMLSVIPIVILGSVSYVVTTNIMEDKATKNSISIISNQINSFDISSNNIIEALLNDISSSYDTLYWLQSVNSSPSVSSTELPSYDTSTYDASARISARLDSIMNQWGDMIQCVMILPRKKGFPIAKGSLDFDYTSIYDEGGAYAVTVKNPYKTIWRYISSSDYTRNNYIQVTRAVNNYNRGESEGIAAIYINMGYFNIIFDSAAPEKNVINYFIDENNNILYSSDDVYKFRQSGTEAKRFDNVEVLNNMRKYEKGSFISYMNGRREIVTYATSHITGWKLISIIPYENIRKDIGRMPQIAVIIAVLCAIYAVFVAFFVYNSIYSPIRKLTKAIKKLGEGELDTRVRSKRTDELGKMSDNFNDMSNRIKKLIENVELEEKKKKEVEIKFLRAQITPHFLYNTLNSIKSLARLGRNDDISIMVVSLIKLLRVSASNTDDFIPIEEELDYVKSYIDIMKFRYDKKINITYDLDEEIKSYGILKFIIQPIVENCIIHAFDRSVSDCTISISAYKKEDSIILEVSDNGVGTDVESINKALCESRQGAAAKYSSIGIFNINERIKLNFGDRFGLKFDSIVGKGTTVSIILPQIKHTARS